jgi:hypothetical protein
MVFMANFNPLKEYALGIVVIDLVISYLKSSV